MQDNISKAIFQGRDEFNPEMFNADKMEADKIIAHYKQLDMGNT